MCALVDKLVRNQQLIYFKSQQIVIRNLVFNIVQLQNFPGETLEDQKTTRYPLLFTWSPPPANPAQVDMKQQAGVVCIVLFLCRRV